MKKPLEKGDFVFVSWSPKLDPTRKSAIGWLAHIYTHESGDHVGFVVGNEDGANTSSIFPHARRITQSSAKRIRRIFAKYRPPTRYDQIWQFLIAEHKKKKAA